MPRTLPFWLTATLLIGLAAVMTTAILGADRAFWYDEVYTLGLAAIGQAPDWPVILRDVHPPTYAMAVRALGEALGLDPAAHALRLLNLIALIGFGLGFWILRDVVEGRRLALLAAMLACNFYILVLLTDLRAYIIVIGFAFLGHAALLRELSGAAARPGLMLAAVVVTWSLHFFGAAIGLATLAVSALCGWRSGRMGAGGLALRLGAGAVLFAGFCAYAFGISDALRMAGGNLWIRNEIDPALNFIGWQGAAGLVLLAALVLRRRGATDPVPAAARWILAPGAMVLLAGAAVSVHTPVLSSRNLSVLVPGVLMAITLYAPAALFAPPARTGRGAQAVAVLAVAAVALTTARFVDSAARDAQPIRWVVTHSVPPGCDGAPVFIKRPDTLDLLAQRVFLGSVRRPPRDYPEYTPGAVSADCPVIGIGWHEVGTVDQVEDFVTERGTPVRAILPPDPRLSKGRKQIQGYLLVRDGG